MEPKSKPKITFKTAGFWCVQRVCETQSTFAELRRARQIVVENRGSTTRGGVGFGELPNQLGEKSIPHEKVPFRTIWTKMQFADQVSELEGARQIDP